MMEETHTGYDVILLDYMMPEMNGLNVLQWMLEQKNQTPVIMSNGGRLGTHCGGSAEAWCVRLRAERTH